MVISSSYFQKAKSKKKKFIDPKHENTQTFSVIHRSQKDPLAADSDAPQRLLQPIPSREEAKKKKEKERDFGVFYDDEYDYLQHMKSLEEFESENVLAEIVKIDANTTKSSGEASNIKLPDVVFASKETEEIGLLNKAAPHSGPLLDWDPDIVETLDDEFKHETVYTLKDEDIEGDDNEEDGLDAILHEAKLEREYDSDEAGDDDSDDYEDYDRSLVN